MHTFLFGVFYQFILGFGIAVINQFVEFCEGFVQIVSAANLGYVIAYIVRNITQALQGIAGEI